MQFHSDCIIAIGISYWARDGDFRAFLMDCLMGNFRQKFFAIGVLYLT